MVLFLTKMYVLLHYSSDSVGGLRKRPIIFPSVVESNTVFPLSVCLKPYLIQPGQWNRNFMKAIILETQSLMRSMNFILTPVTHNANSNIWQSTLK